MPFRKPLINMSPKFLLNYPKARSNLSEMVEGTEFQRIIGDAECEANPSNVRRVIFCTGKVYHDIYNEREARGLQDKVAIVRIEQIAPFPHDLMKQQLDLYPTAKVYWAQEEHKNMGAYEYCKQRIRSNSNWTRRVNYAGRNSAAAAATGSKQTHKIELKKLLAKCFEEEEDFE